MKKNPNVDLLVAGAKDFLKASAAIAKFGNEIYEAARAVLKKRTPELTSAGLSLNMERARPHPKDGYVGTDDDGTEKVIGASVPLQNGCCYNLFVWWRTNDEDESDEMRTAYAAIEFQTVSAAQSLLRTLNDAEVMFKLDGREVYTEEILKPEDFATLEPRFDKLVGKWIARGEAIGGLKKYLK